MSMDVKSIANMAVLAGEIMLRSGAETYRVEDTIKHILDTAGTAETEALVMLTGIIVTINRPGQEPVTIMRRVHDRGTNMHRIVEVNEISRKYCAGELSAEETQQKLKNIKGRQYTVQISSFILNILCTAGIAVTAAGLKMWIPALNMDTVIISCIMPLVPGVAITNAIRDTLRGDYISGGARALEAFVTAAAVAIGAGVGMASMNLFLQGGGLW